MKNKLTLYTLSGCRNCENLKSVLDQQGIKYQDIVCSDRKNDAACNEAEMIVDCELYPIAKIAKKVEKDVGGYFVYRDQYTIIHYCRNYDEQNTNRKYKEDYTILCVYNALQMIDLIIENI